MKTASKILLLSDRSKNSGSEVSIQNMELFLKKINLILPNNYHWINIKNDPDAKFEVAYNATGSITQYSFNDTNPLKEQWAWGNKIYWDKVMKTIKLSDFSKTFFFAYDD